MPSKYDFMTKEEILEDLRRKRRESCYRKTLSLSLSDGKEMEELLKKYNCANPSQFLRRIIRGELEVLEKDKKNSPDSSV